MEPSKKAKQAFDLHVLLIETEEGCPKARATFLAWCEGEKGLQKRMPSAPLFRQEEPKK